MENNIFQILLFTFGIFSVGAQTTAPKYSVKPTDYSLEIITKEEHFKDGDSATMKYEGTVTIDYEIVKSPDFNEKFGIILNTNPSMELRTWELFGVTKNENLTEKCTASHLQDKIYVNCTKNELANDKFKIKICFLNFFGNDMTGFYRSSYKTSDGSNKYLLTTHFEPIYARRAFPCFDQPDLKAYFTVTITAPVESKTVLSNTPVKKTNCYSESNLCQIEFKRTVLPMSTYLVAFTVSDFKGTEPLEFHSNYPDSLQSIKRLLTTYGRPEIINRGDGSLAQNVGKAALEELEKYLGIGYAFEKVDQIGIPDFSAGAMENWGHISFREKSLYYNKSDSTTNTLQANLLTITHELVHQWFGNLVTLESWDYIWLNEAFANYLEYVIASKFKISDLDVTKWNLVNQMVVSDTHLRAFETDGVNTSKPLTNKITDENLIFSSFNDIPYAKGASVLRMWDMALKDDGFKNSLNHFIQNRKEKTSNPKLLYESFKLKTGMDEKFFKSWTEQSGYPVVEVKKGNGSYSLTQSPFYWEKSSGNKYWYILVTYSTNSSKSFLPSPNFVLENNILIINGTYDWIIVNNQQSGYYRVNYETDNWINLGKALMAKNYSDIPELNRAQIINDVHSLARSLQKDYVNYSIALNLSKYLRNETSYVVWKTALSSFDFLQTKLYKEAAVFNKFTNYVLGLLEPRFKNLSSTELDHLEKLMHIETSRWACNLGYQPCVDQAKALYNQSAYKQYPDIQETVLCTVVRSDSKIWDDVFKKYTKEQCGATKIIYLSALGCSGDDKKIQEFLNKTLDNNSLIRKQDLPFVLSAVYNGNLKNVDVAFAFIKKNYKNIAQNFGGINPLGRALLGIAKKLSTQKQLDELKALAEEIKKAPEGKAALDSVETAVKIAASNFNWVNGKMNQCIQFFNAGSLVSYSLALLLLCLFSVFQF